MATLLPPLLPGSVFLWLCQRPTLSLQLLRNRCCMNGITAMANPWEWPLGRWPWQILRNMGLKERCVTRCLEWPQLEAWLLRRRVDDNRRYQMVASDWWQKRKTSTNSNAICESQDLGSVSPVWFPLKSLQLHGGAWAAAFSNTSEDAPSSKTSRRDCEVACYYKLFLRKSFRTLAGKSPTWGCPTSNLDSGAYWPWFQVVSTHHPTAVTWSSR